MIQNKVILREEDHKYFDDQGKEYIAWSRFIENYFPFFDKKKISAFCAGKGDYVGMSQQDVLDQWEGKAVKASNHGTNIHDALENFGKSFSIAPEHEELEPLIKSIYHNYKDYYRSYDEEVVYTKYGIAGKMDKLFIVHNKANSPFIIEDFKTNLSKGIEFVPGEKVKEKFCLHPIEHLTNCNYTKYALQLSMYAYMVEELTGRKCLQLIIRYIPPHDKMQHVTIPVPYLKAEIRSLLDHHQNKFTKIVESTIEDVNSILEEPTF